MEENRKKPKANPAGRTKRMANLAIFTAVIIVLQVISSFIKFGPVSITLALAPIIIGAALYGPSAGAYLGLVMGIVVFVSGLFGWDGGFVLYLMSQNAWATVLICLVKTAAAGWLAGLVYQAASKKKELTGVVLSGIVCPVVNTGLFIAGMFAFFFPALQGMADAKGTGLMYYIIFGIAGINFVIELLVNLVLSSGITRIIQAGRHPVD